MNCEALWRHTVQCGTELWDSTFWYKVLLYSSVKLLFICTHGFIYSMFSSFLKHSWWHATYCILLMLSYFICCTKQQVFVYSCVCMPMISWWVGAYAFTRCMKIVIVFPVIASSCFRTTQTKRSVAPVPASLSRHEHRSPLGNRRCAHSLTEISRRKQAWPQGIREER